MAEHRSLRFARRLIFAGVLSLCVLLLGMQMVFAYEREIPLPDSRDGKQADVMEPVDRFAMYLTTGIGNSYQQTPSFFYTVDSDYEALLGRLGQQYSENMGMVRLTTSYAVNARTGIYVGLPLGYINVPEPSGFFAEENYSVETGDIYVGTYYELPRKTEKSPFVTLNFDLNLGGSKVSSLGDGVTDYTLGAYVRKMVTRSSYLTVMGDHTIRAEKNGVDLGDATRLGVGFGLVGWGELLLQWVRSDEITIDGSQFYGSDKDLVLSYTGDVGYGFGGKGGSFAFTIGGLDEELSFETTTVGVEYTFRLR